MPLSIGKAWDETKAAMADNRRLIAPVALGLILIPAVVSAMVEPRVAPGERINLTGVYPRGEGATMQVQRFENGWTDFPVTARVSGGTFTTYVLTGRTGESRWRVTDVTSGRSSNPVRVTIR